MNTPLLRNAIALALGLIVACGASAQDALTAQQKELEAAREALDQATQRYAALSLKYQIERGTLRKPVIGVILTTAAEGVRIAGVTPDSAAAEAGLKSGDILVSIDGHPLDAKGSTARTDQARELLAALDDSRAVTLDYQRDGKTASVLVTPKIGERILAVPGGVQFDGHIAVLADANGTAHKITADNIHGGIADVLRSFSSQHNAKTKTSTVPEASAAVSTVALNMSAEVVRLIDTCKETACQLSPLIDALRWNGLNLAAINVQLGRYFGTNEGVLILRTSKDDLLNALELHTGNNGLFNTLQPGDVILKIAGTPVTNPREVMELLRALPAGGSTTIDYLQNHKLITAQISKPRSENYMLDLTPRDNTPSSITIFDDTPAD